MAAAATTTRHTLLRPCALAAMALALFLAVFALMLARVRAGTGPIGAQPALVAGTARGTGAAGVRTSASGGVAAASPARASTGEGPASQHSVVAVATRTSGAGGRDE